MFAFGRMFITFLLTNIMSKISFCEFIHTTTPGDAVTGIGSYSIGLYLLSCVESITCWEVILLWNFRKYSSNTATNVIVSLRCKGDSWNLKGCWPHEFPLSSWVVYGYEEIHGDWNSWATKSSWVRMVRRSYWLWVISLFRDTSL